MRSHSWAWLLSWAVTAGLSSEATAEVVWSTGSTDVIFFKPAGADYVSPGNQDRITGNVWLTRASSMGLFNIKTEGSFSHFASPADTEWAFSELGGSGPGGTGAGANPAFAYGSGAAVHGSLTFTDWEHSLGAFNFLRTNIISHPGVVHLITDDIYLDVQFTAWGDHGQTEVMFQRAAAPGSALNAIWNSTSSGNWSQASMWSTNPNAPANGTPAGAVYNATITAGNVTLNVSPAINKLYLYGGTLAGTSSISTTGGTIASPYNVMGVTTVTGGTLYFTGETSSAGSFTGTGSLVVENIATLTSGRVKLESLQVDGMHFLRNEVAPTTSKVHSLAIDFFQFDTFSIYTAALYIQNNRLIVQADGAVDKAAKVGQLITAIDSGFNGGDWFGLGITSSNVANDPTHNSTIALFDNADFPGRTSFGGESVNENSLIITRALLGDGDNSTIVDATDFDIWFRHVGTSTFSQSSGDFNRSGIVDATDFDIWFRHVGVTGLAIVPDSLSASAVPEPASVVSLGGAMVSLMLRRRR